MAGDEADEAFSEHYLMTLMGRSIQHIKQIKTDTKISLFIFSILTILYLWINIEHPRYFSNLIEYDWNLASSITCEKVNSQVTNNCSPLFLFSYVLGRISNGLPYLNEVLNYISLQLFKGAYPYRLWGLIMPSTLVTAAGIALLYGLSRRLGFSRPIAVLSVSIIVLLPIPNSYAFEAHGYALIFFTTVVCIIAMERIIAERHLERCTRKCLVISITALILAFSTHVPTYVYGAFLLMLIAGVEWRRDDHNTIFRRLAPFSPFILLFAITSLNVFLLREQQGSTLPTDGVWIQGPVALAFALTSGYFHAYQMYLPVHPFWFVLPLIIASPFIPLNKEGMEEEKHKRLENPQDTLIVIWIVIIGAFVFQYFAQYVSPGVQHPRYSPILPCLYVLLSLRTLDYLAKGQLPKTLGKIEALGRMRSFSVIVCTMVLMAPLLVGIGNSSWEQNGTPSWEHAEEILEWSNQKIESGNRITIIIHNTNLIHDILVHSAHGEVKSEIYELGAHSCAHDLPCAQANVDSFGARITNISLHSTHVAIFTHPSLFPVADDNFQAHMKGMGFSPIPGFEHSANGNHLSGWEMENHN